MCGAAQLRRQHISDFSCSGISGNCKSACTSLCAIREITLVTVATNELQFDKCQVRVQWWGDRGPGTLLHLLPGHSQALVHFPVCCSSGSVLLKFPVTLPNMPYHVAPVVLIVA